MTRLEALGKIAKVFSENKKITTGKIIKITGLPKGVVKKCLQDLEEGMLIHKAKRGVYEIN